MANERMVLQHVELSYHKCFSTVRLTFFDPSYLRPLHYLVTSYKLMCGACIAWWTSIHTATMSLPVQACSCRHIVRDMRY